VTQTKGLSKVPAFLEVMLVEIQNSPAAVTSFSRLTGVEQEAFISENASMATAHAIETVLTPVRINRVLVMARLKQMETAGADSKNGPRNRFDAALIL
jgi:hypothetical protein